MNQLRFRTPGALLVLWAVILGATSSSIQARSLSIEYLDALIVVDTRGVLDVTEEIRVRFEGEWNGVYRFIPVEYRSPRGFSYRIWLDLISIADETGKPLRYERSRENHYLQYKIWIPGAVDTSRTVRIRYKVTRALRFFEDYDELFWNVTGDESLVPVERVTATVRLPEGVGVVRVAAFTGAYGSREQSSRTEVRGSEIRVISSRALNIREGLSVAAAWNPGVVRRPGILLEIAYFLLANWVFGVPLLVLAGMFFLWSKRGRDPEALPVATRYEPPDDLTPAEVGTLLDHKPDLRDITATIVDLAVRGYIQIEEVEKEKWLGLISKTSYMLHSKRIPEDWQALQAHERKLLEALFLDGSRASVEFSELKNKFYKSLEGIRTALFDSLIERGYYRTRPDRVWRRYLLIALAVGIVGVAASDKQFFGLAQSATLIAGILSGVIVAVFGFLMPARTVSGARTLEAIQGFQDFLERVESDRFKRMITGPEMFEKYLSFAMVFGVDEEWATAFEGIYTEQPKWYTGGNRVHFHSRGFTSNLQRMSAEAGSVMTSAPRNSSGSGFRGGGSGGGFGGGGVGGF